MFTIHNKQKRKETKPSWDHWDDTEYLNISFELFDKTFKIEYVSRISVDVKTNALKGTKVPYFILGLGQAAFKDRPFIQDGGLSRENHGFIIEKFYFKFRCRVNINFQYNLITVQMNIETFYKWRKLYVKRGGNIWCIRHYYIGFTSYEKLFDLCMYRSTFRDVVGMDCEDFEFWTKYMQRWCPDCSFGKNDNIKLSTKEMVIIFIHYITNR